MFSPKRISITVIVITVILSLVSPPASAQFPLPVPEKYSQSENDLQAGTAKIDITPEKPVKMAGYGSRTDLSKDVHDPLSARVIIFKNNGKKLVLVSADLIGFYEGTADYMRKAILDEFQLEPSELFLSAIHTHSGPSLTMSKEKGHPNNLEYTRQLKDKLIKVIDEAMDNFKPVNIGAGVGYAPVGSNRRQLVFDSSGNSSIRLGRNPYGPTDKEVLVAKVADPDGKTIAALFDYATHATCLGPQNYTISGDVIGLAEQFVEKILGEDVIAAAFAGASGNIDPWYRVLPAFNTEPGWIPEPVLLGTLLGEEAVHTFRSIEDLSTGGEIVTSFVSLRLPGKTRNETEIKKDSPPSRFNITAARVGDIAFIGLGGEVLTEIGMKIKAASPYKHTFIITHCNGSDGYLPPEHLYIEGGYEVRTSPFAPKAAGIVVKKAVKMLHEL
ncbi:MAG: neutral/alkaline non-lysosomal ceramidase N-terminal domain-containing protein [Sedimentisphaerales bacterium]|nr:neutral/alkaline non-lysosomal ceramidase N-terminal domain-containing protein [Sedimentisphaerales bacterium]